MLTTTEQKNMIMNIVFDQENLEDSGKGLISYLQHIGFDISAIESHEELVPAVLGHYRVKQGEYDIDRATMDLATYGPVAAAIVEGLSVRKSLAN